MAENLEAAVSAYVEGLTGRSVDPHTALISTQLLESIAAVQLIEFVERAFAIDIDDEELVLANFDSVAAIVALVRRKDGGP